MKKMVMIVAMMLLGLTNVFAISGDAEVSIASTFAFSGGTFPTDGNASALTVGADVTDLTVVSGLTVNDNSELGWTMSIDGSEVLTCADHTPDQTIAYTMQIANVSGTLGTGLTLAPAAGADLTFVSGTATISPTGTATTPTVDYSFDLVMDIASAAHSTKLVGTYVETLTITLAAD
ncbi:MAG: hypothetical protein JXR69_06815 [Candidatus Delongbacteria bacterium]|nr:hypothetical protein [Candidatus Delongbacteria bacterium]